MRTARRLRREWVVLAVAAGIACGVQLLVGLLLLVATRWVDAVLALLWAVVAYWFAKGAWLRTPWGHVESRTPPPDPPPLSSRHALLYTGAAGLCAVACVIAVGVQALIA